MKSLPCPLYCWRIVRHLLSCILDPECDNGRHAWEVLHYWHSKSLDNSPKHTGIMNKAACESEHFRRMEGNYSERFHGNGGYEGFCDVPELFDPLIKQYKRGRERIDEISAKTETTKEDRRERENLIRQCGSWAAQLREGAQMAFERMFIIVAQARLPKEHFIAINDEARTLWTTMGFNQVPHQRRKVHKAFKRVKGKAGLNTSVTTPKIELPACS